MTAPGRSGDTRELVGKPFGLTFWVVSLPIFSVERFDIHIFDSSWVEASRVDAHSIRMAQRDKGTHAFTQLHSGRIDRQDHQIVMAELEKCLNFVLLDNDRVCVPL